MVGASSADNAALTAIRRLATASADGATIALVFGTIDFAPLLTNWACHALGLGVEWFAIVAMDDELSAYLQRRPALRAHAVRLPGDAPITKLSVIGERQIFGLRVLESGLSVVHTDADALWLRDPTPLFAGGDVVAERIWGKPLSVVKAWGAGICTGFYYLRSTAPVRTLARAVRDEVARKRARQPSWQASDQFFVNVVLHRYGVRWRGGTMAPMTSLATRFSDPNASYGVATNDEGQTLRLVMLPHRVVPRACPVLSNAENRAVSGAARERAPKLRGKAKFWWGLLQSAFVLHCFPPGGDPEPGEKRFVFMGHPKHTQAEVAFARRQNLWRVEDGSGACVAR